MTAIAAQLARCRPFLEPALAHGEDSSLEELLGELEAGRAQLWAGENCAFVTQLVRGPEGGSIHAWLGGGKLREMLALRPGIEAWGRTMGATWATIEGRAGWGRALRAFGYEPSGDLLRKAL